MDDHERAGRGLLKIVQGPSGLTYRVRVLQDLREYELLARRVDEVVAQAQMDLEDAIFQRFVGVASQDLPFEDRAPIIEAIFTKVQAALVQGTAPADEYSARVADYRARKGVSIPVE